MAQAKMFISPKAMQEAMTKAFKDGSKASGSEYEGMAGLSAREGTPYDSDLVAQKLNGPGFEEAN